jgi:autophagy-related protein 9
VVELFSLVLTLWLSVFLFAYVDWHALATCKDETTCQHHLVAYLIDKPFRRVSLWNLLVILYCLLFLCYTAFFAWTFLEQVRDALEAKHFFEEKLGISEMKLEGGAVDWDRDVVEKIVSLQMSGEHRVAIHGQDLDALVVAQRILRKENFMVAFFNRRMLDLTVPGLTGMYFCKSLEVRSMYCWLDHAHCSFVTTFAHVSSFVASGACTFVC